MGSSQHQYAGWVRVSAIWAKMRKAGRQEGGARKRTGDVRRALTLSTER